MAGVFVTVAAAVDKEEEEEEVEASPVLCLVTMADPYDFSLLSTVLAIRRTLSRTFWAAKEATEGLT